jgi:hypothetical protein
LLGKIAILVPQLCFKGQRLLSTFKTVSLVPKILLLDRNHPSVDAALHEADIKSLFLPLLFFHPPQFPPAPSQAVSHC